jgi:hypothetical protein
MWREVATPNPKSRNGVMLTFYKCGQPIGDGGLCDRHQADYDRLTGAKKP